MKFDVVFGAGPHYNNGRYVLNLHVENHLSLVDSSGYYAGVIRNEMKDSKFGVFTLLDNFTYISTTPINKTWSVHIWQK